MLKIFKYTSVTPVDLISFVYDGAISYASIYELTIDEALEKKYTALNHLMCWFYCTSEYTKPITLKSLLLK